MKTLFALLTLASACTTQAVDDTITVRFDVVVPDVDLNCVETDTDDLDPETQERTAGFVYEYGDGTCWVSGYYRGAILDFDELRASLPDGVRDVVWTDVSITFDDLDLAIDGLDTLPAGTYFELGAAVTTDSGLDALERTPTGTEAGINTATALLTHLEVGDPSRLFRLFTPNIGLSAPLSVTGLTASLGQAIDQQIAGREGVADLFNQAYASDDENLYILAGTQILIDPAVLPETPSDLTLGVELTLDYAANAEINLLGAASGAAAAE